MAYREFYLRPQTYLGQAGGAGVRWVVSPNLTGEAPASVPGVIDDVTLDIADYASLYQVGGSDLKTLTMSATDAPTLGTGEHVTAVTLALHARRTSGILQAKALGLPGGDLIATANTTTPGAYFEVFRTWAPGAGPTLAQLDALTFELAASAADNQTLPRYHQLYLVVYVDRVTRLVMML